jgi:hypothetical protein
MARQVCRHDNSGNIGSCTRFAVAPPVGYKNHLPRCFKHVDGSECALYQKELLDAIVQTPDVHCPICNEALSGISTETLVKTSCCKQFFCKKCLDSDKLKDCPICREPVSSKETGPQYNVPMWISTELSRNVDFYHQAIKDNFEKQVEHYRETILRPQLEALNTIVELATIQNGVNATKFGSITIEIGKLRAKQAETILKKDNFSFVPIRVWIPTFELLKPSEKRKASDYPEKTKVARTEST